MPGHIPDLPALGSELSRSPGRPVGGHDCLSSQVRCLTVLRSRCWLCLSKMCSNPLSVGIHFLLVLSLGAPEFHYAYYLLCEVGLPFICPKPLWLRLQREPPPPVSCRLMTKVVWVPLSCRLPSCCVSLHVPPAVPTRGPQIEFGSLGQKPWNPESNSLAAFFILSAAPAASPTCILHPQYLTLCQVTHPPGPRPILPRRASHPPPAFGPSFQPASQGLIPSRQPS